MICLISDRFPSLSKCLRQLLQIAAPSLLESTTPRHQKLELFPHEFSSRGSSSFLLTERGTHLMWMIEHPLSSPKIWTNWHLTPCCHVCTWRLVAHHVRPSDYELGSGEREGAPDNTGQTTRESGEYGSATLRRQQSEELSCVMERLCYHGSYRCLCSWVWEGVR